MHFTKIIPFEIRLKIKLKNIRIFFNPSESFFISENIFFPITNILCKQRIFSKKIGTKKSNPDKKFTFIREFSSAI